MRALGANDTAAINGLERSCEMQLRHMRRTTMISPKTFARYETEFLFTLIVLFTLVCAVLRWLEAV